MSRSDRITADDIPVHGIPLFPTKPLEIKQLPDWTKDARPPVVTVSLFDRMTLFASEQIRYAKWAMVVLWIVVKAIRIIQLSYSEDQL